MAAGHAWIASTGMATPVGGCSAQTAASVRAGVSAYCESTLYNRHRHPMTLALLPEDILPPLADKVAAWKDASSRQLRMLRIAHLAIEEATSMISDDVKDPLTVFLATPERMPGHDTTVGGHFINHLADQSGFDFGAAPSRNRARARGSSSSKHRVAS